MQNGTSSQNTLSRLTKMAVAWIIAIDPVKKKRRRQPGSLKGKLQVGPEFFEPLPASDCPEKE